MRSREERDIDGFGGGVEALFLSSDGNLLEKLVIVEWDISHDVGATPTLGLRFGRAILVVRELAATTKRNYK